MPQTSSVPCMLASMNACPLPTFQQSTGLSFSASRHTPWGTVMATTRCDLLSSSLDTPLHTHHQETCNVTLMLCTSMDTAAVCMCVHTTLIHVDHAADGLSVPQAAACSSPSCWLCVCMCPANRIVLCIKCVWRLSDRTSSMLQIQLGWQGLYCVFQAAFLSSICPAAQSHHIAYHPWPEHHTCCIPQSHVAPHFVALCSLSVFRLLANCHVGVISLLLTRTLHAPNAGVLGNVQQSPPSAGGLHLGLGGPGPHQHSPCTFRYVLQLPAANFAAQK